MDNDNHSKKAPPSSFLSRPDTETERIIEIAVRMVMEVGLSAAEEYLRGRGISTKTSLRVLNYNPSVRRRPL